MVHGSDIMKLPNLENAKERTNKKVEYIYEENRTSKTLCDQKYFLKTYGCQMNLHDSEEIKARLESMGALETMDYTSADIVILNTCAIRENAHDKVFGFLGRCKHLKKSKPELIIGLCGCMAQEENVVEEVMNRHPHIDIVFGTHNINELSDLLENKNNKQQIQVYSEEGDVYENILYKRDSNIKAWVNIMLGCNNFCTYCIVPYTRGKQRSRKCEDIVYEINNLVKDGYQEVTLLGQNVNSYGIDLIDGKTFAELLKMVSETGIKRIRFVTSNPWDFSEETIQAIASCDNVMPYIHLPIQSGSSKTLRLMGRKYTAESYLELFNKIKCVVPNVSITTDIIVGFPNETEEDFLETLKIAESCKFDGAYTFIYSPRAGTPAAKIEDNVDLKTKENRLQRLNEIIRKYAKINNEKLIGKEISVLIEGTSEKNPNRIFGYTDTMKLVNIDGSRDLIGKIVEVKIVEAKSFSLYGEVLNI